MGMHHTVEHDVPGLSQACLNGFDNYLADTNPASLAQTASAALNVELSRYLRKKFEIWVDWSGAMAREGYSLTDRLEAHEDILRTFTQLLSMINVSLDQVNSQVSEGSEAAVTVDLGHEAEEVSIAAEWTKYQGTPWAPISVGIHELLELTSSVRRSTRAASGLSVPVHFQVPDEGSFKNSVRLLVRKRFPSARTSLTDQIGDTIHLRRRYLLYRQNHERKLRDVSLPRAKSRSEAQRESAMQIQTPHGAGTRDSGVSTTKAGLKHLTRPFDGKSAAANTDVSKFSRSIFLKLQATPSRASGSVFGSARRQEADLGSQYPGVPPAVQGRKSCYYCSKGLPDKITVEKWRDHVRADLKPYVCISEKCLGSPRYFPRETEWEKHMSVEHGEDWTCHIHLNLWYCKLGHNPLEEKTFSNAVLFEDHLRAEHETDPETIAAFIARRRRPGIPRKDSFCPLCEIEVTDDRVQLLHHIADHLHSLALLSLPRTATELGYVDDNGLAPSATSSVEPEVANSSERGSVYEDGKRLPSAPHNFWGIARSRRGDETLWNIDLAELQDAGFTQPSYTRTLITEAETPTQLSEPVGPVELSNGERNQILEEVLEDMRFKRYDCMRDQTLDDY
ncbi:hypothetical protein LTR27_010062 [Elasticomyces elasticus]|nr:hypothetical protein LTR27_010062 [Elasticomyces elasticus]